VVVWILLNTYLKLLIFFRQIYFVEKSGFNISKCALQRTSEEIMCIPGRNTLSRLVYTRISTHSAAGLPICSRHRTNSTAVSTNLLIAVAQWFPNFFLAPPLKYKKYFAHQALFYINHHRRRYRGHFWYCYKCKRTYIYFPSNLIFDFPHGLPWKSCYLRLC
jgi:hypothetical protein